MSQTSDTISKMYSQMQNFADPMVKANKMAAENLEKVIDFQLKTFQKYTDMSLQAIKAAAEIDSPSAFQAYVSKQVEAATAVRQEMLEDFKAWTEISTDIREDMQKFADDRIKNGKAAATKAAKKAA